MKRFAFHALLWTPLLAIAAGLLGLVFATNLPQLLYLDSIRNLPMECLDFVAADYVYKAKPGPCPLRNLEYDTVLTHDPDGFRVSPPAARHDVVVLGDSHAHGVGVADGETFAALLATEHGLAARNLAIGSYATLRELEVLADYGRDASYVVLQYCENDANENRAALTLPRDALRAQIESGMHAAIASYAAGKALGLGKPLRDLGVFLREGAWKSKAAWRKDLLDARHMEREAADFARVIARYQALLARKRLVVLESSGWLANSPRFAPAFAAALGEHRWLAARVLDTPSILAAGDGFFLDDHPNAAGHRKLAAAIAREIAAWERTDPILGRAR